MTNIFNLFLFLFALWVALMFASENISWFYIFFGIIAASLISFVSFRLKLLEEKSELLYLSFGFYRHFVKIFLKNFFTEIRLIIDLAFKKQPLHPLVYQIKFMPKSRINMAVLIASFNMSAGLLLIGSKDDELMIHAINEDFLKRFDLQQACAQISKINDDNLV
jgi:multisubunit Na+/H+ antiporter MnhE subunit